MEIRALNKIFTAQLNKVNNKHNLESKDTVSFSGTKLKQFDSGRDAYNYYKKVADVVNESLDDDDEITAFETLGYDIDSDFETEKITINGDYKPFFEYRLKTGNTDEIYCISYKDIKVNEEKLLANVEKITGKKLVAPNFEPPFDYKIDNTQIYQPNVEKKLLKLIKQRVEIAKLALADNNSQQALESLGFKTKKDENGKITIEDGYSHILLSRKSASLTLKDYDIDEQELLKDVVQIKGESAFSWEYKPDHYIQIDEVKSWRWNEKAKEMALMNPTLIEQTNNNKEKLANGDNFSVLQNLGYDVEKAEDGKIKIKGTFSDYLQVNEAGRKPTIQYAELGYDVNSLLKNVSYIDGNLFVHSSKLTEVDKDLVITGELWGVPEETQYELFKDYVSKEDLYSKYNAISPEIIDTFVFGGVLTPAINSKKAYFFKEIDAKTNEILTNIVNNRDKLLEAKEISEKYGVSPLMIKNAMQRSSFKPYLFETSDFRYMDTKDVHNYLFDITDTRNEGTIKHFEKTQQKVAKERTEGAFNEACLAYQVEPQEKSEDLQGTGLFTFGDVERFGYGTKTDLIAHCDLLVNAYAVRKHLYEHEAIKISHPTIKSIMNLSRECNPALVKLSDLEQVIGDDFRKMVIDGKFSIITSTIFEKLPKNKYCINLNDEKNMQALKSIDNPSVQKWLAEKIEDIRIYKKVNEAKVEEFKQGKSPTKDEAIKEYEAKQFQAALKQVLKNDDERIAKKRRAWENRRNLSLRSTIAWVLSPNTKEMQKEKTNPVVKEILDRNTLVREIHSLVLAGEMTSFEAEEKIKELKLTKEEEISILSFYKGAWEMAGTEEWINALKQAKDIAEAYKQGGLDAITDNKIKDRLELWEKKWGKN